MAVQSPLPGRDTLRPQDPRRCWAPTGLRPDVRYQVIREFVHALVAVQPATGSLVSLVMPWVDATTMSIFLARLAKSFPDEVLLILDGAGCHHAHQVSVPGSVRLIFLPPYSPQLNPTEHIWDHLRENYFANRTSANLSALEDRLCDSLSSLAATPNLVRSLTSFDWLNTLPLT